MQDSAALVVGPCFSFSARIVGMADEISPWVERIAIGVVQYEACPFCR